MLKINSDYSIAHLVETPNGLFNQDQLAAVIKGCKQFATAAEAGRTLFNVSRPNKTSVNDSHRVSQFLSKFKPDFKRLKEIQ